MNKFDEVNRFLREPIKESKIVHSRSRIEANVIQHDIWEQYIITCMY